jgi:hypothetical protein
MVLKPQGSAIEPRLVSSSPTPACLLEKGKAAQEISRGEREQRLKQRAKVQVKMWRFEPVLIGQDSPPTVSKISPEILALYPAGGGGVRLHGYFDRPIHPLHLWLLFRNNDMVLTRHRPTYRSISHLLTSFEVSSAIPLCGFESCLIQDAAKVYSVASDASNLGEGPPLLVCKSDCAPDFTALTRRDVSCSAV